MLIAFSVFSCQSRLSFAEVLHAAKTRINNHKTIQYDYRSTWDTRAGGTVIADSAQVAYAKLEGNDPGFGFFVNRYGSEFLFDGTDFFEARHGEKTIVRHDPEEITANPDFFSSSMFFLQSPLNLASFEASEAAYDTILGGQNLVVFLEAEERPSGADSTRTVRQEKYYFIDYDSQLLRRTLSLTTLDKQDTLQLIEYQFSNYHFSLQPYDFSRHNNFGALGYREIRAEDLEEERRLHLVSAGDKLEKRFYPDINGKPVPLYGEPGSETIVMFSFIGCGGCEYTMREMKKEQFKLRDGIRLYYSSPVNPNTALKAYLAQKEFPFPAFSQESNMNEDFGAYFFPTFVRIDAEGVVTQVLFGYGEDVRAILFD